MYDITGETDKHYPGTWDSTVVGYNWDALVQGVSLKEKSILAD